MNRLQGFFCVLLLLLTGLLITGCRSQTQELVVLPPAQVIEALPTAAVPLDLATIQAETEPARGQIPTAVEPITLDLNPASAADVIGNLPADGLSVYLLDAAAGQSLNLQLTSPRADAHMTIMAPDGSMLKAADQWQNGWQGIAPQDGTYELQISSDGRPTTFDLAVEVVPSARLSDDYTRLKVPFTHGVHQLTLKGDPLDDVYFLVTEIDFVPLTEEGISQTIRIADAQPIPLAFPNTVLIDDMNDDGYLDFGLLSLLDPTGTPRYNAWLFDPDSGQFIFNDDLSLLPAPTFLGSSRVASTAVLSDGSRVRELFEWENNALTKLFEERCTLAADGTAIHLGLQISDGSNHELFRTTGADCPDFGRSSPIVQAASAAEPVADDQRHIRASFTQGERLIKLSGDWITDDGDQLLITGVDIYQESVLLQSLPLDRPVTLSLSKQDPLFIQDWDDDGYLDLSVRQDAGSGEDSAFLIALYDVESDRFVVNRPLSGLLNPRKLSGGVIQSRYTAGAAVHEVETYHFEQGALRLRWRETCLYGDDGTPTHLATRPADDDSSEESITLASHCDDLGDVDAVAFHWQVATAADQAATAAPTRPLSGIEGVDQMVFNGEWVADRSFRIDEVDLLSGGTIVHKLPVGNLEPVDPTAGLTVRLDDFNYDGRGDIAILQQAGGNPTYTVFLYSPDSGTFNHSQILSTLVGVEVLGDDVLRSTVSSDSGGQVVEIYEWFGEELHLLVRETCQPDEEGALVHTGFQFNSERVPEQTFQTVGETCVDFGVFE